MRTTSQAAVMTPLRARAILGVASDASPAEVEAAFRRAIRDSHPDRGGEVGRAQLLLDARRCLRAAATRAVDADRRVVVVPAPTRRAHLTALLTRLADRCRLTRLR